MQKIKICRILFAVFYELLPKFSDFVNSDECIRQITSQSISLRVLFKKRFEVYEKQIFSSEKIRN